MVAVGQERKLRAVCRDKSRREIDTDLTLEWSIEEGEGSLDRADGEFVTFVAPSDPELARIIVVAEQEERRVENSCLITVTAELIPQDAGSKSGLKGLPGYTYVYSAGQLWRSHYDQEDGLITVNSGHADFVHASRKSATKLRYIARLFAKEIILANFPGESKEERLERMVELNLYMDESLR